MTEARDLPPPPPPPRCTWPEPSRNADHPCGAPAAAWWWTVWGFVVARCRRHFSEKAATAAEDLGWIVNRKP